MKRMVLWSALALFFAAAAFAIIAPPYVDSQFNDPLAHDPYRVDRDAAAIYASLPGIADLHADPLLWKRDLNKRNTRGHLDVPRLIDANMALQVFGAVTKTPRGQNYEANSAHSDNITRLAIAQLWPVQTWWSLEARAIHLAQKLEGFSQGSNGALVFVRTRKDLEAVLAARASGLAVTAGIMGLEGAHALEGDLDAIERLYAAGYRMLGLAHFFDNEVAGSVHGMEKYGLTAFGESVMERAEEMGMAMDVAHASHAAIADVLKRARTPIFYSHGGVKGTCDTNRNITDVEILGIAATGGLIGLGAWDEAACGTTPADLARAMHYVAQLAGPQHVALGTDFDGGIKSAFTLSDYDVLVGHLIELGYSADQIEAMLLGNVVRVLRQTLPAGK